MISQIDYSAARKIEYNKKIGSRVVFFTDIWISEILIANTDCVVKRIWRKNSDHRIIGAYHRLDGPAIEYLNNQLTLDEYWIDGESIPVNSLPEFLKFVSLKGFW